MAIGCSSWTVVHRLGLDLFHESVSDAHHRAAIYLALMTKRVDDGARVVGCGQLEELNLSGVGIHADLGDLRAVASDVGAALRVGAASNDRLVGAGQ